MTHHSTNHTTPMSDNSCGENTQIQLTTSHTSHTKPNSQLESNSQEMSALKELSWSVGGTKYRSSWMWFIMHFVLVTAAASDSNEVGSAFIRLNLSLKGDKEGENLTLEMKPKMLNQLLQCQILLEVMSSGSNNCVLSCLSCYKDKTDLK